MSGLDSNDKEILRLLQRGDLCKPRVTKIAHTIGLPTTTVHSKLKKMEKEGYIDGYKGRVNSKKVGIDLTVFVILKVRYAETYEEKEKMEGFGEKLAGIPEVQEVHICSSDWDYFLKVKAKDADDYRRIVTEEILPLGGIEKSLSYISYGCYKETLDVPIPDSPEE